MTAARALASIASSPSVGPTTRCSMIFTGTGSEPPWMSAARSLASAGLKSPVIWVEPPVMPTPQATLSVTWGEEITLPSSTMATRRSSPAAQAALAVSRSQVSPPPPLNRTSTAQPPRFCGS